MLANEKLLGAWLVSTLEVGKQKKAQKGIQNTQALTERTTKKEVLWVTHWKMKEKKVAKWVELEVEEFGRMRVAIFLVELKPCWVEKPLKIQSFKMLQI